MSEELFIHGKYIDLDEVEEAPSPLAELEEIAQRVSAMEEALDEMIDANEEVRAALQRFAHAQQHAKELTSYLGSEQWISDFEADEAGMLPANLKRGVLSEDEAFNALADNFDTAIMLLEIGTKAIKNS